MRILAPDETGETFSIIITEHKGKSIEWNATDYERGGNNRSSESVFKYINQFFEYLPITTQDKIWDIYVEIKDIMETVNDPTRLINYLTEAVKRLYSHLPLEDMFQWINFKSDIQIPATIKDSYDINDPIDRTYIRQDYAGLILIAFALRPIVPIWSDFNCRVKSISGNAFKESQAFWLLNKTEIMYHPAMEKLRLYVEASTAVMTDSAGEGVSVSMIIGGLGTTELPEWLLALSVVRRVAIGDFDANSPNGTIISNVYKFIGNQIQSMDKRFKGKIKKKEQTSGEDEDNASIIEQYKVKQEQSDGDLVALSVYTEEMKNIIERIQPDMDLNKYLECFETVQTLVNKDIQPHQITLTQWVIDPVIPARGVEFLNKQSLLRIMALCQAVLWHRGFNELALLITARSVEMDEDTMFAGNEMRSLIPKDLMDELIQLYPFYPELQNKQQGERKSNPASKAIDIIARDLIKEEWEINAPIQLSNGIVKMLTPPDIKSQLARYIIDRSKRGIACL